jgi:5-hydroxyisourate hydrolase-like protein (transthyretin family)
MLVSLDVVDAMFGRPAEGIPVTLRRDGEDNGLTLPVQVTDPMGRVSWPEPEEPRGRYKLEVQLDRYYGSIGVTPFQSCVQMDFRVFDADETVNLLLIISPTSNVTCRLSADLVKS